MSQDPYNGIQIMDFGPYYSSYPTVYGFDQNITTAYDCCVRCIDDPLCAYSVFGAVNGDSDYDPTLGTLPGSHCHWQSFDTCDVAADQGQWIASPNNPQSKY